MIMHKNNSFYWNKLSLKKTTLKISRAPFDTISAYHNMFKHQMPFKDPIWSGAKLVYDSLKKSAVCDAEDKVIMIFFWGGEDFHNRKT